MKIIGVYKITNTITGDFYVGSSKDVKRRWAAHKCHSTWKKCPNNPMYLDMRKYGTDKFDFQVLAEVEIDSLKEKEQQFIETLKPTYNSNRANGWNIERYKEYKKSDEYKESQRKAQKKYHKSDKFKETHKKYQKSDKGKESHRKANNKYYSQLCFYNGETITLNALANRFWRQGIPHPAKEAKKFIIKR